MIAPAAALFFLLVATALAVAWVASAEVGDFNREDREP